MTMGMRTPALVLAVSMALAPAVYAEGPATAPAPTPAPVEAPKPVASVTNAATRGITLKVGITALQMGIFYLGTGSVATSGAVSAINAVSTYALYVGNEYMWDKFYPPPRPTEAGEGFAASAAAWRNMLKFATFKPAAMAAGWGALYAWTGSLSTTITYGGLTSLLAPGVFYANNMAWDWYDWYAAQPPEAPPAPTRSHTASRADRIYRP